MTNVVGSIGEGIAALGRARAAAAELAGASIPLLGGGRSHAKALRSDALDQVRLAHTLLGDAIGSYHADKLATAVSGLEQARFGAKHIHPAAAGLATVIDELSFESAALGTRVTEDALAHPAWNDPQLLRTRLAGMLADQAPLRSLTQRAQGAELAAWMADSPAMRALAPALPEQWATSSQHLGLAELFVDSSPQRQALAARVLQHVIDGTYASPETRRTALERASASARIDRMGDTVELAALIGRDESMPWAHELVELGTHKVPRLRQSTAIESTRLHLSGAANDVATIDAEAVELIQRAASSDGLDIDGWARLRARVFDHGAAGRLGLGPHVRDDGTRGADPRYVTYAWHDHRKLTTERDLLVATWNDQIRFARSSDETLRRETLELIDQWPTSNATLRRQLFPMGLAHRLGLQLDHPATEIVTAMTYRPEDAVSDVARWSLQLDGTARDAARADARTRELLQSGPYLSELDRSRLSVLVHEEGVAARLDLPIELEGELDFVATPSGRGNPAWRYQRLWKQLVAGELRTSQGAAARTRELLDGPLDELEQLHRIGAAAVDAGGANALGLPLQLAGLDPATQAFRGVKGLVIESELRRYATAWRALLSGGASDAGTVQRGLVDVLDLPDSYAAFHESPAADATMNEFLLHGFDLPGAPLRGIEDLADPLIDTFARSSWSASGFIKKWRHAITAIAEPTTTPARLDRMRALVDAEHLDDAGFAELYGQLHALGAAAGEHGLDVGKLRALLVDRLRGSLGSNVAGARARLLLREALGMERPPTTTDESFALAHATLDIDARDGDAVAAAYVGLVDRQLLARLLPESAGRSIARLESALGAYRPNGRDVGHAIDEVGVQLRRAQQLRIAQRAGAVADPVTLRHAVAKLMSDDVESRRGAALDVFLHGFDLPGAPLTRMRAHEHRLLRAQLGDRPPGRDGNSWVRQLHIVAQDMAPSDRMARLRTLAHATRGELPTYAESFAHLVALGDDAGEIGGVPLAGIRDLMDARLHGPDRQNLAGARGWVRMREAFGLETAPVGDDVAARVQRALAFDSKDPDAVAAAYVELFDRGLLAQVASGAAPEELARYGELLQHAGHSQHLADESLRLRIEIDPDGALRQLLELDAATAAKDAHEVLAAIARHPRLQTPPTTAQRARILTASEPSDLDSFSRWLTEARVVLASDEAAMLGATGRDLIGRVDVNLQRLSGRTPVGEVSGYGRHPDYAEVGRVRSGVELVGRMLEQAERKAAASRIDAAQARAGVETLTW